MKPKTNNTSDIQRHFREVREIIAGRGDFKGWDNVEKVDALNKWVDELYRFRNAITDESFDEPSVADRIYPLSYRVDEVIDEAESALKVFCKAPVDRTIAEIMYPSMKAE